MTQFMSYQLLTITDSPPRVQIPHSHIYLTFGLDLGLGLGLVKNAISQIEPQVIAGKSHDVGKYFLEEHDIVNIRQLGQLRLHLTLGTGHCPPHLSLLLLLLSDILELVENNN